MTCDVLIVMRATDTSAAAAAPPVFISYSSNDDAVARQVCAHLEAAGFPCWIAPRNIPTGEEYADHIVSAIDCARLLVLVFSPAANASKAVRKEVELATNRGIPVLPVMIERTVPTAGMEFYLRTVQWRSAFAGPLADSLRVLEAEVRAHLNQDLNPVVIPLRRLWRRTLNLLGGATLVFLFLLAAAAMLLWITRVALGPDERRLAVAALIVALLAWPILRWQGIFNTASQVLGIKVVALTVLFGAWTAAAVAAHRVPVFSGSAPGILVARIAGDGDWQPRLVATIHGLVQASGGLDDDDIEVKALARRVSTLEEARQFARTTGANVVVWGTVTAGLFQAHVTMADGEGLYDARGPIMGNADLDVEDATAHVEQLLVNFLGAWQLYQKKNYGAARDRFTRTLGALKADPEMITADKLTPLEAALSTIYFYRATTHYQLVLTTGDRSLVEAAVADYSESIRYVSKDGVSAFATPVANLAGILLARGTAGDVTEAERQLASTACETKRAFAPIPCLYIEYHRGVIDNLRERYAAGRARFTELLTVSWPAAAAALPSNSPHQLLLAYAYKNRAYAEARLADMAPASNRRGYKTADEDWRQAQRRFATLQLELPAAFYLTRARIDIGLMRAQDAKDALALTVKGDVVDPDVHLVGATIARCSGDVAAAGAEEAAYVVGTRRLAMAGRADFAGAVAAAKAHWARFEGLCDTRKEQP